LHLQRSSPRQPEARSWEDHTEKVWHHPLQFSPRSTPYLH
jgi:hypothetical protein